MEDGLVLANDYHAKNPNIVLILVVVEDVLVPITLKFKAMIKEGLNPCCGGRCSSTENGNEEKANNIMS